MKTEIKGKLRVIKKLNNSRDGNPRYKFSIGCFKFKTPPNDGLAYEITNHDGYDVTATVDKSGNVTRIQSERS